METSFTPLSGLLGGLLIGSSALLLLWANGRIAGISGIVGGLISPQRGEVAWRLAFVIGMLIAAFRNEGDSEIADLNLDGVVDTADLGIMIRDFGATK